METLAKALPSLPVTGVASDPKPDFVLVFKTEDSSTNGKDVKAHEAIREEYDRLLGVLKAAGLEATGRSGGKDSQSILIFVRATTARLSAEVHRERLSDWLHGIVSPRPSPMTPRDLSSSPVTPSERLRLVHSILTSPPAPLSSSITSSSCAGKTCGLTLLPHNASFPHLVSLFPPHDMAFNREWLGRWSARSHILRAGSHEELTWIKDHLGEGVALYFAFLRFYWTSLAFPAFIGALFWLAGRSYSPVYAFLVVSWSIVFVESWRLKERVLAVAWGTHGVHNVEVCRAEFKGETKEVDPVSGVEKEVFPWWRTTGRQMASIPVLLGFVATLATLISGIYVIETLVGEVYDGPGKRYLTLVPTILFAGLVPQVTKLWERTARQLTGWENHARQSHHDTSLTLKVFALNFFVAYGSLLLTSYVYIPFGSVLVPHILSLLPSHPLVPTSSSKKPSFSINASKLHTQILAYTLTNQIVGAFLEIGLPIILRLLHKEVAKVQEKRKGSNGEKEVEDEEDEKAFLERMRFEATLPEYSHFADYAEMTGQFGYATLFSVIWPIAPVWSFVNNFFELRSDAFKLTTQARRPIPSREATIGPWLEVLSFITWFAALTNASLVYLYQPYPCPVSTLSKTTVSNALNTTLSTTPTMLCTTHLSLASLSPTPEDLNAVSAILNTLFVALLVGLVAEHAYFVVRGGVRYVLERIYWKGGEAENVVRRGNMSVKRAFLTEVGMKESPKVLAERSGEVEEEVGTFWRREKGVEELRRRGNYKAE